MGIDEWTVQVLEDGVPPLPDGLERGQTVAVARWCGERYGAVLFLRLWKNGEPDSDCALAERRADGTWEEPSSWGGGGWIDDPFVRPEAGWRGDPVLWLGTHATGEVDEDDLPGWVEEAMDDDGEARERQDTVVISSEMSEEEVAAAFAASDAEWEAREQAELARADVRAIMGAASLRVAAIEVDHDSRTWAVPIESPSGAFVVGIEGRGPAVVRALDHEGRTVGDELRT